MTLNVRLVTLVEFSSIRQDFEQVPTRLIE